MCLLVAFLPGNNPTTDPEVKISAFTLAQTESLQVTSDPALALPNDRYSQQQWSMQSSLEYPGASGLFDAQAMVSNPKEVIVAIVDSGVLLNHEDLNFLPGYDFISNPNVANDNDGRDHDPSDPGDWVNLEDIEQEHTSKDCMVTNSKWHGTAIAGIIGATTENILGIAGGASTVAMLPVRVTGKCGGYVSDLITGIRWAAGFSVKGVADNPNPANIINVSLGFKGECSETLQHTITDVVNAGVVVVTAATNSSVLLDEIPYSPAVCKDVISIAAVTRNGWVAPYSAVGKTITLYAPGGSPSDGIITTQNDGTESPSDSSTYGYHYGTSIAAAHVSAAVAVLLSYQPDLSVTKINELLVTSANPKRSDPRCFNNNHCDRGSLNAVAAVQQLMAGGISDDEPYVVQLAASNSDTLIYNTDNGGSSGWVLLLCLSIIALVKHGASDRSDHQTAPTTSEIA